MAARRCQIAPSRSPRRRAIAHRANLAVALVERCPHERRHRMRAVQSELHDVLTRHRRVSVTRAARHRGRRMWRAGYWDCGQPRDVAAAVGGLREEIHRARPRRAKEELAAVGRPDREELSTPGSKVARVSVARPDPTARCLSPDRGCRSRGACRPARAVERHSYAAVAGIGVPGPAGPPTPGSATRRPTRPPET